MIKTVLTSLAVLAVGLAGTARAAIPILGFDEVAAGMKGNGRTVFSGTEITDFEVEILGKLPNVGPGRNLILGRCSGGPLAETGILAGMSGSPVTIDGQLIGAVAYSWGFATDAIAGITPIEEMLEIAALEAGDPLAATRPATEGWTEVLERPDRLPAFFSNALRAVSREAFGRTPIALPISVSGFSVEGLTSSLPDLDEFGWMPVQSGTLGRNAEPGPPLEAGSAIGLQLVRGDLEMTATGTVTWVDGNDVLALGHPLFSLGAVDLPMTGARVEALLPSLQQSARIAVPLGGVGALRQDRSSGVFGVIGASPRMIPVRLQFSSNGREYAYSFDIADDPLLSPLLLYASLNGVLAGHARRGGNITVRLREGSVIKMLGGDDVALDNLFSGPAATLHGTGIAAYILHLLMNNAWTQPQIAGVNLLIDHEGGPRTGRIRRVVLDRANVRAGERVEASVFFSPYRGADSVFKRSIEVPAGTPAGPLTLHVGGALTVSRAESSDEPRLPRDLSQLVRLINQLRRNDRIYILATREDTGLLLDGARLANLPPSAVAILEGASRSDRSPSVPRRGVFEETIPTGHFVEGLARIEIEVIPR